MNEIRKYFNKKENNYLKTNKIMIRFTLIKKIKYFLNIK